MHNPVELLSKHTTQFILRSSKFLDKLKSVTTKFLFRKMMGMSNSKRENNECSRKRNLLTGECANKEFYVRM